MKDLLIKNARILDGSGGDAYVGDVAVQNGRFAAPGDAAETIDASGLTLTPGFIDAHSHGDLLLNDFGALTKLSQGITTQVAGQCGVSLYPAHRDLSVHRGFLSGICTCPELPFPAALSDFAHYSAYLDGAGMRLNLAVMIGHGSLRMHVMGDTDAAPTLQQLHEMRALLDRAMAGGALGMSTGLVYAPCCYAGEGELTALLRVVASYSGTYATHIRDEADGTPQALAEAIRCAKHAGCALVISHFKLAGQQNFGLAPAMLRLLDAAAEGEGRIPVTVDSYPYLAGMTALNVSIPPRFRKDGLAQLCAHLNDPCAVEEMRREMAAPSNYENYILNCGGFAGVMVSACPVFHGAEGYYISDYAKQLGMEPFDAYIDILRKNGGLGLGVYFHMAEEDVAAIAAYRHSVVGTDGLPCRMEENGHPRAFGAFPRAICHYVKETGLFTLPEMIHRMTGKTAARLHIPNKGLIREGYDADFVLMDYHALEDQATYRNSNRVTKGIRAVYVAGAAACLDGALTGERRGRLVRRGT